MTTKNIADLRSTFYGGGLDAEYNTMKAFEDAGITANSLLAVAGQGALVPTVAIAESLPRTSCGGGGHTAPDGQLVLTGIYLKAGSVVSSIGFPNGASDAYSYDHLWYALYSPTLHKLRVTADDTTNDWPLGTFKSMALTSAYTVPTTDTYFIGVCVAYTPPDPSTDDDGNPILPSLTSFPAAQSFNFASGLWTLSPIVGADCDLGLTTPDTAPAVATVATRSNAFYGYVS